MVATAASLPLWVPTRPSVARPTISQYLPSLRPHPEYGFASVDYANVDQLKIPEWQIAAMLGFNAFAPVLGNQRPKNHYKAQEIPIDTSDAEYQSAKVTALQKEAVVPKYLLWDWARIEAIASQPPEELQTYTNLLKELMTSLFALAYATGREDREYFYLRGLGFSYGKTAPVANEYRQMTANFNLRYRNELRVHKLVEELCRYLNIKDDKLYANALKWYFPEDKIMVQELESKGLRLFSGDGEHIDFTIMDVMRILNTSENLKYLSENGYSTETDNPGELFLMLLMGGRLDSEIYTKGLLGAYPAGQNPKVSRVSIYGDTPLRSLSSPSVIYTSPHVPVKVPIVPMRVGETEDIKEYPPLEGFNTMTLLYTALLLLLNRMSLAMDIADDGAYAGFSARSNGTPVISFPLNGEHVHDATMTPQIMGACLTIMDPQVLVQNLLDPQRLGNNSLCVVPPQNSKHTDKRPYSYQGSIRVSVDVNGGRRFDLIEPDPDTLNIDFINI